MNIQEILEFRGVDIGKGTKLIRHQDSRYDISSMYLEGMLQTYQRIQSKDVFKGCKYIISFIGIENTKAVFVGVYEVKQTRKVGDVHIPSEFPYPEMVDDDFYYYELDEVKGFDDLKDRLVIEWGKATRSWHQWISNEKSVVQIYPEGYLKSFPGYFNFTLSFDDLAKIIKNPDANREWHTMLRAVSGIYLILDIIDGRQYIGSAYGSDGILGRWKNYVNSKHGGNKLLIELLDQYPKRYKDFQFTILHTLSSTLTDREVIEYEKQYKLKLGTRAFGLNDN